MAYGARVSRSLTAGRRGQEWANAISLSAILNRVDVAAFALRRRRATKYVRRWRFEIKTEE